MLSLNAQQAASLPHTTLSSIYHPDKPASTDSPVALSQNSHGTYPPYNRAVRIHQQEYSGIGSTARGIMIGIFSVLGAAGFVLIIAAIVYYFRYTQQGRIFLDRITRPGEYDDEQQFAKEEAEALEDMDDLQRAEYLRAKGTTPLNRHTQSMLLAG
jgi:hypothetical protein